MAAWKTPPLAGAKEAEPSEVLPVVKVIAPVGMPTPVELTVTVKVTDALDRALYGLMKGAVMTSVEVVGAVLTERERMEEVLPSNELEPR
jgi:hypothetical protein